MAEKECIIGTPPVIVGTDDERVTGFIDGSLIGAVATGAVFLAAALLGGRR